MTYGEIQIEALRLLFANGVEYLDETGLADYRRDERYRDYCQMMAGAVNRALADLEARHVLMEMQVEPEKLGERAGMAVYERPAGCETIDRVVIWADGELLSANAEYVQNGGTIYVPAHDEALVMFVYQPRPRRVTDNTGDDEVIGVPPALAALIPYYVAGDLDRQEEPERAAGMRQLWEAGVAQYAAGRGEGGHQELVRDAVSGGVLTSEW